MIQKMNFIGQLLHEEYSSATFRFDPLLAGRIRQLEGVKSISFVRDDKLDLVFLFMTGNLDFLFFIETVTMDDRIVDSFGQADENVWIQIFINMQTLHQVLDKGFNLADTTGMRG